VTLQFDFEKLITNANGMLPASVYTAISEAAKNAKADVLEVGTAHGASAIAAAKGLSKHHLSVKTIDRLQEATLAISLASIIKHCI
jgi:methylase of polypeptide subunit release factors